MQNGTATLQYGLTVSYNTLTILLAIVLLDIYPTELKPYVHTKPCTLVFAAALILFLQLGGNQDILQ